MSRFVNWGGLVLGLIGATTASAANPLSYTPSTVTLSQTTYGTSYNNAICVDRQFTGKVLSYYDQGPTEMLLTTAYDPKTGVTSVSDQLQYGAPFACTFNGTGSAISSGVITDSTGQVENVLIRKSDDLVTWKTVLNYTAPNITGVSFGVAALGNQVFATASLSNSVTQAETCAIFGSQDGGNTWSQVDEFSGPGNAPVNCTGVVISSPNGNGDGKVIVNANYTPVGGLSTPFFRVSTDGGGSWANHLANGIDPSLAGLNVYSAQITEDQQGNLIASELVSKANSLSTYVLVSQDGGSTWSSHLVGEATTPAENVCKQAVTDSSGNIYVSCWGGSTADPTGEYASAFRSSDLGNTWTLIDTYSAANFARSASQAISIDASGNVFYPLTARDTTANQTWLGIRELVVQQ